MSTLNVKNRFYTDYTDYSVSRTREKMGRDLYYYLLEMGGMGTVQIHEVIDPVVSPFESEMTISVDVMKVAQMEVVMKKLPELDLGYNPVVREGIRGRIGKSLVKLGRKIGYR